MPAIPNAKVQVLDLIQSANFWQDYAKKTDLAYSVGDTDQILWGKTKEQAVLFFKRGLIYPNFNLDFNAQQYSNQLAELKANFTIILAQASGNVALAQIVDNELVNHKVIRKYTQRKQQGKAQIKHLKTKGKSRLGSRIRLQQTEQLFFETHEKLREWNCISQSSHLFYSCDITMWSLMMDKRYEPAFDAKDSRLIKIPLDLQEPNFDVLKYVHKYLYKAYVEVL